MVKKILLARQVDDIKKNGPKWEISNSWDKKGLFRRGLGSKIFILEIGVRLPYGLQAALRK
jgi:hypothetical protein